MFSPVRCSAQLLLLAAVTLLAACSAERHADSTTVTATDDALVPAHPADNAHAQPRTSTPPQNRAQPSAGKSVHRELRPGTTVPSLHVLAPAVSIPPRSAYRRLPTPPVNRENYGPLDGNPVRRVARHPVSTFSIDVDTGSYANVRRLLNAGRLPPTDAVRVEELINYFRYAYPVPSNPGRPFSVTTAVAPTPWNPDTHLLRIGIQGWRPPGELPPANLVFLIDVSGSMRSADKLPLLQSALKLLAKQLGARDRVSIVVYAGASGLVLEPTPGDQTARIIAAINGLSAGGSTNGGAGIRLAYSVARQAYIDGGINRVILATDGDFNVGTVDFQALVDMVARQRDTGIALTTLGFGSGNYNEHLIEQLANQGNGSYAYIDSLSEAERVLVSNRAATLRTIAKDVKVQVEFNPAVVAEYRLIGYRNRLLERADFSNDRVDAGEIGAGQSVTALYEIALTGSGGVRMDPLRYQDRAPATGHADELALLRLRYKLPDGDTSHLIERPIAAADIGALGATDAHFRFAAAVAAFGQLLRGGTYTDDYGYRDVLELARGARGKDADGRRGEFLQLVQLADALAGPARSSRQQARR